MSYRIISADCHIDMTWMPGDLWVKNAPARFRDRVPQVRQTDDGPRWYAEEKELGVFGGLGFGFDRVQRGFSKHVEKMFEVGFYEGGPHPTTPDLRLKDQDLDDIDAEVMYGILGIGLRGVRREGQERRVRIGGREAGEISLLPAPRSERSPHLALRRSGA